jgi:polyisoprenoid-binding protein YceI
MPMAMPVTMIRRSLPLGALLLALVVARPASAVEYSGIDAAASKLAFTYTEMGVNLDGSFARYSAKLAFDPTKPQAARVAIDVQMASVDAGAEEATTEVAGTAWFDTAHHPLAHFESTGVTLLAPGRYQLSGNLMIKGRTHAIVVPVSYQAQGVRGVLSGEFLFNRSDYGVGEGEWADTSIVANAVRVRFNLTLTAGK